MCTLTVFPRPEGVIVTMNRDEADSRDEAGEFLERDAQEHLQLWWPLDSVSKGTWFGARGDGLVAALLNRYQGRSDPPTRSRGQIIPELLRGLDAVDISGQLRQRDWAGFAAFDLVLVRDGELWQASWDSGSLNVQHLTLEKPWLLVSSSADYEASVQVRHSAFQAFERLHPQAGAEQIIENLHRRTHPENLSLGFRMRRPGRHTRSISQAVLRDGGPEVRYLPLTPAQEPSR